MKFINSIKKIFISLKQSINRFPLTLFLTSSFSILLIINSEISKSQNLYIHDILSKIAMIVALAVPISLILKFIYERYNKVKYTTKIYLYLISCVFLLIYYFAFIKKFDMVSTTRYTTISLAFYLIALITPYFYNKENLELYTIRLLTRFFVTFFYAAVLQFGISAILFTIDKLLGIHVYNNLYLYVWFLIIGIFIPSYFLSGIPQSDEKLLISDYSKVLKILIMYIVIPLISVYTIILYIYFAKILIILQWPKGLVGNLVLWYSAITTIVIYLIWPIKHESNYVNTFIKYITKLIIPLILIMFLSLGIRIRAYGITENRYFVIALGLWVLIVMIYWNLSKLKKNIFLPLSLAIIAILSVTGPFSAYSVSIKSQNKRFENILIKNNMLKDNKIVSSSNISKEDKKEISSILYYFEKNHSFKDLKYIPPNFRLEDMNKIFGFNYMDIWYDNVSRNYFSYTLSDLNNPIDIKGYDYLFNFRYPGNLQSQSKEKLKVEYSYDTRIIKIFLDNNKLFEKDLTLIVKDINNKYGFNSEVKVSLSDMTYTFENEKLKIKFIIFSVNGNEDTTSKDNIRINSIEFDLLVNIK
ncbi:MAG: DUF4153 domain-containing protein [Caloramator sp.]|nr:DUF4153 domain-containing protein [Caloramator sp.]